LDKIRKLTDTTLLSRKKGEIYDEYITPEFVHRFNNELNYLNANKIRVKIVKSAVDKGKVLHKIQLQNSLQNIDVIKILSEGESRIVSM
jgi:hypothetical protein